MNRETKVGLLVGLAFIIVIGILLSDYNRLEVQPAPLTAVGDSLRTGAATPHNGSTQIEIVPPPASVAPSHPVLTREEVREGTTRIAIGPGPDHPANRPAPGNAVSPTKVFASNNGSGPVVEPVDVDPSLQKVARDHGAELTRVTNSDKPHVTDSPVDPTVNGARQYVAVAGDTVSKLAGRFLGGNTKSNREAILAVNPTLKQNPNNVIVGRTYVIPTQKSGASPAAPAAVAVVPADKRPESPSQAWYTVKDNDSLWKIAAEQLGDGTAWIAIRDMNKDILKGSDAVRTKMRLRLPPKSVASTN